MRLFIKIKIFLIILLTVSCASPPSKNEATKSSNDIVPAKVDKSKTALQNSKSQATTKKNQTSNNKITAEDLEYKATLDDKTDYKKLIAKRIINFDFDKSKIKKEYMQIIKNHAKYLAAHKKAKLFIEGHADERGSREFNIALGYRRAKSVMGMLTLLGSNSTQIKIISYGEELPSNYSHNEKAWKENRRVEFVYE